MARRKDIETVPVPGGLVLVPLTLHFAHGLAWRLRVDPSRLRDCLSTRRLRTDPRQVYALRAEGLSLVAVRVVPLFPSCRLLPSRRDFHLLGLEVADRLLASAARALWGLAPEPTAGQPPDALDAPSIAGTKLQGAARLWSLREGRLVRSRLSWRARAAPWSGAEAPPVEILAPLGPAETLKVWVLADARLSLCASSGEFPL